MKPQFIIIAILITLKVIGVASRANADYFCHYKDKDYGFGYNSDGFSEHGHSCSRTSKNIAGELAYIFRFV